MIEKPILLELPMPIKTPRLVIMPPAGEFAEKIDEAILESLDVLRPWMPWVEKEMMTLEDRREMLIRKSAAFLLREDLMFLVFTHEGEFVMATGLTRIKWDVPSAEIGYWCRKSAQGKGYVTEASNALIRYAFEVLKVRKVDIGMDSENIASENVAKRLNMVKEAETLGTIRTLHTCGNLRRRLHYVAFDTASLPPLEVNW